MDVRIKVLLTYFDNHYHEECISLFEGAKVVHLCTGYLSALFTREVGIPSSKYLINLRIEKAKELLLTTDLLIKEICIAVGWTCVPYFIKQFKGLTGMTPQQYRIVNRKD